MTANKVQLIDLVCEYILKLHKTFPKEHRLILATRDPVSLEIHHNIIIRRQDMLITHKEADFIIANQVVYLAKSGYVYIKVICDDRDVFVLLVHFYVQENLSGAVSMIGTSAGRIAVDIKATTAKHADMGATQYHSYTESEKGSLEDIEFQLQP